MAKSAAERQKDYRDRQKSDVKQLVDRLAALEELCEKLDRRLEKLEELAERGR